MNKARSCDDGSGPGHWCVSVAIKGDTPLGAPAQSLRVSANAQSGRPCGTVSDAVALSVTHQKVTKTKTRSKKKQETILSDVKHDLHCGFVELRDSVSVS